MNDTLLYIIISIFLLLSYTVSIFYIKYDHMKRNYDDKKSHRLLKINVKYLTFFYILSEIIILIYLKLT